MFIAFFPDTSKILFDFLQDIITFSEVNSFLSLPGDNHPPPKGKMGQEFECISVTNLSSNTLKELRHGKILPYMRKEQETYYFFYEMGFGLVGIILGTAWDRLCLLCEEYFHCERCYNGKKENVEIML